VFGVSVAIAKNRFARTFGDVSIFQLAFIVSLSQLGREHYPGSHISKQDQDKLDREILNREYDFEKVKGRA
jgi:hypothetical protein